jgi:hypothetical protein
MAAPQIAVLAGMRSWVTFKERWLVLSKKIFLLVALFLFAVSAVSMAQKLQTLVNQPADGTGGGIGFLLTDGTVIFQGNSWSDWWKLTPDKMGSYINGTWTQIASFPAGYVPYAFSSAVLADGRVVAMGGEYDPNFSLTNMGAIYDPAADTWTALGHPDGWGYIGDSPSVVLPDGKYLIGRKLDKRMAVLDPATLTWTEVGSKGKNDFNAEEGWTLMPDGSVLTYDVRHAPHSERYIPSKQEWLSAGSTIVDLHSPYQGGGCLPYGGGCYPPPGEVGPGMLRPDGTVFATGSGSDGGGGPGHTAVYHPSDGKWTVGPDFPNGDNAGDSYAVLLPNGHVLVLGVSGSLYEFDGTNLTLEPVGGVAPILLLPTGETICIGSNVAVYTSPGKYSPAWAPAITTYPHTVTQGTTYKISGMQFNGLSQAAAFGDELQTATNYPLVRITNNATKHVFYAKTHNHSTMAVATGNVIVSTHFDIPADAEMGESSLEVVANGIPSKAVAVTVN